MHLSAKNETRLPIETNILLSGLQQMVPAQKAIKDASADTGISNTKAETPAASLQILLVEDNLINQKVAQRILAQYGLKADTANNGVEALQALELKSYDLILMDIQMPVMDGISATKNIPVDRAIKKVNNIKLMKINKNSITI